jgi:hypothetical protein
MISADPTVRRCEVAAILLAVMHFLTVCGMAYQGHIHLYLARDDYDLLINYGLWLSPALAILALRRVCPVVFLYAVPILIDFAARGYFVWDYYCTGVNSIWQKGDGASWLTTFMGMISLVVLACWLTYMVGALVIHLLNRLRQPRGVRSWRR